MTVCTFFGHRDCPSSIKSKLWNVLVDLIENHSVSLFYVGDNGYFDRMVRSCLRDLKQQHPQINYAVVLEHMPKNGLLKKGAIIEAGFVKTGKTYGRVYAANISGEEYYCSKILDFCGQNGLPNIFSALIHCDGVTIELIDQIEAKLADRKKELLK